VNRNITRRRLEAVTAAIASAGLLAAYVFTDFDAGGLILAAALIAAVAVLALAIRAASGQSRTPPSATAAFVTGVLVAGVIVGFVLLIARAPGD
jgi:4-hydroxybenzoate polyprenyltransferase